MRILHVVPTYYPATRYGGPIVSVHELCAALAKRGHEIQVYTTNVDGPSDSDVPIGSPVVMAGVKVWYFSVPAFRRLYWAPAMKRAMRARIGEFSIVHTHSVFLWPTWAAARLARARSIPYVVSPRGMMVKELIRRRSTVAKRVWISCVEKGNLENASAIHVTSATEAAKLSEFSDLSLPQVHVVPNGVTSAAPTDAAAEMPIALQRLLESGQPTLLCLGRINWKKGIDRIVRSLPQLPSAHLLVVGSDEDNCAASLQSLARELGVGDRLHVFDPVFGKAKASLYRAATLFVLASHSENFGNVVLEAMAEGCPVVVSRDVGAAAIVEELHAGAVVDAEPATLAPAIAALLADPLRREAMGRKAKVAIPARYGWDAIAAQMETVYHAAIAAREARQATVPA